MTNPPAKRKAGFTLIELLVCLSIIALLVAFLFPAQRRAREPARRSQCKHNFKQIVIALHNYAEKHGAFPPAYTVDAEGNRLHSWRTLILPYLDQEALYKRIDLSKPWNDPANAEAFKSNIYVYQCPSSSVPANHTAYLAMVGENGSLHPTKPRPLAEITDGATNTLLVIEVPPSQAVHWMSPMDADEEVLLDISPTTELPHTGGFHAAFADGRVTFLSAELDQETRKALASIAGNDKVGDY